MYVFPGGGVDDHDRHAGEFRVGLLILVSSAILVGFLFVLGNGLSSLTRAVRSAVIWTSLTLPPVRVIDPVTLGVLPTAVWPPMPANCSFTW